MCCGEKDDKTLSGYALCRKCCEKKAAHVRENQSYLKSRGRCVRCGSKDERTLAGKTVCGVCAEKQAAYNRRKKEQAKAEKEGSDNG